MSVHEVVTNHEVDAKRLLRVLTAASKGDFSQRLPAEQVGVVGKIYDSINEIVESNERLARELEYLGEAVGKEGKISQRIEVGPARGRWADSIRAVNTLVGDLVQPTAETARVIGAVAKGDLNQTMALELEGRPLKGEFLRTAKVVNGMVKQLNAFGSEVPP